MINPMENGHYFGTIEAARKVGISTRQLYHWVDQLHVVTPKIKPFGIRNFRRFSLDDLEKLSRIKSLLEKGYTLRAAAEIVKGERNEN